MALFVVILASLVGVIFFSGSSLSVASTHKSVSRLATRAIVNATTHMSGFEIALKLGKLNCPRNEFISSGTGTFTRKELSIEKLIMIL